jgi:PAS domain S-box-containing protein
MGSASATMNLLLLTSRQEEGEAHVTFLRTGGLAVRGTVSDDLAQLQKLGNSPTFDLIICCEYDGAIDLTKCMEYYRQVEADVPLVIVAGEDTESATLIGAMRSGARDVTQLGDDEHLLLVVARELSDLGHRRAEEGLRGQLRQCEHRVTELLQSSTEAIAYVREGVHLAVNHAYAQLFRFEASDELDGFPLLDLIAPDKQGEARRSLRALDQLEENETEELKTECIRADGVRFRATMRISRSNLEGEPCLQVITSEKLHGVRGASANRLDSDTGLPNRTALMEELAKRLEPSNGKSAPVAAIYIGMNGFDELTRTEGLSAALEAVAELGAALREQMPEDSFLARLGDAGFALLVENIQQRKASDLAAQICSRLRSPRPSAGTAGTNGGVHTGLMLAEPGSDSAANVLDTIHRYYLMATLEARQGPKHSKGAQASGIPGGEGQEPVEPLLTTQIDRALQGDGFELFYQPIVSLKGDSQENYSVLLRLRDENRTVREAKEFLPEAIQSGRMVAIDHWVVRHAVAEVAARREQLHKINFFINISEETLCEDKLLIWVCDYLREFQAHGNWLTFQIIEEHARRQSASLRKLMEGLSKVKCRLALNRFGLAPNPEMLLKGLQVHFVKFAPELGQGLADDAQKHRRLLDLTKMVRDAGAKTVVTGVEDARSLTLLWTAGVDYVQGNFLQKPTDTIDLQGSGRSS